MDGEVAFQPRRGAGVAAAATTAASAISRAIGSIEMWPSVWFLPMDRIDPTDPMDRIDPAEPIDPMDPAEPMEATDPIDPMLAIDPRLPSEPSDPNDHADNADMPDRML